MQEALGKNVLQLFEIFGFKRIACFVILIRIGVDRRSWLQSRPSYAVHDNASIAAFPSFLMIRYYMILKY